MAMGVAEASDPEGAIKAVTAAGRRLRDIDGAGVIILGCAGMGVHRTRLQKELGLPVIDPVQAAVGAAISALDLNSMGYK